MRHSVVTIGTFDGVHTGHQYLIKKLIDTAKKTGLKSILVTLSRPVRSVAGFLTTQDEKIRLLKEFTLDEVIVLPNSSKVTNQTARSFFEDFLCRKLNMRQIIIGGNFAFGHRRQGNISWLREEGKLTGIKVDVTRPRCLNGRIISSSWIRELLLKGKIEVVNELLGRNYSIEGFPQKGYGLGRKIGFPTINVKAKNHKLMPLGIYAAIIERQNVFWPAAVYVGRRPTLCDRGRLVPEIHMLNFRDKWPKKVTKIHLCSKLRSEKAFRNINLLKHQIKLDVAKAKRYFKWL